MCVFRLCCYLFFFFKQKTAYEMRISDWSSDVCSSDLPSSSPRAPMPQSPGRRPAWPHHRGAHHMSADAPAVPQLTLRAIILSVILAMILAAANAYLGLFAGLTIATAIPAAVVSMAVLRVLGGGSILENNIVQTGASAGSSIAAGVIFTIPALIILGYWQDFRYSWVLAIAGLGGLLGVLFSVPLRRTMIVEEPLPFPEGKAAAEVIKAGDNTGPGLKILALSGVIGGVVKQEIGRA